MLKSLHHAVSRKAQVNIAAFDRYSAIRSFFRSQIILTETSNSFNTPRQRYGILPHAGAMTSSLETTRQKSRENFHDVKHREASLVQAKWKLATPSNGLRVVPSFVGLGNYNGLGSVRLLHSSLARSSNNQQHDSQPETQKKPPTSEPETPPISEQEHASKSSTTSNNDINQNNLHSSHPLPHQHLDPMITPKHLEDYSRFFQRLALSLPHPHRPTRDDFLAVATGFWERLRIRFKWFTIKSFRKFNADDISAFITWFLMSQTLWILVGTTTFFSVVFAIANSLRLQHYIARAISDYLTSETGVTIIFESAIVPKWRESRLSFKNVYVSRRPAEYTHRTFNKTKRDEHLTAVGYDVSNHPGYHRIGDDEDEMIPLALDEEDTNYSLFDLTIDSVDVTLSLWRWLDGKGLIEDAVVRGVRGVLDRRNVYWDPENPLDPALFRHKYLPGDFELESMQLEDVLVTVYQPGGFRPYTASIFRADIRQFRKRWMFYDFLCAENVVGQFDNCLFSLHKPQSIGRTTEKDLEDGEWSRMSRIRIDGVNIDHLKNSTTMEGPISWITSGKVDAVLDIKFPRDPHDDLPFNVILGEIADAISTSLNKNNDNDLPELKRIPGQRELARPPLSAPPSVDEVYEEQRLRRVNADDEENADGNDSSERTGVDGLKVVIDIDLRFRDLKAAVPIFTNDLSYVNNAFIRPIVAFMNANRTLVPIHCRVVKDLNEFDGSWTMWETGLMDDISIKTYDALAYHVSQANFNRQRVKTVSLWSLQMTVNGILSTLKNIADPFSAHLREVYLTGQQGMGLDVYHSPVPLGIDL